MSDIVTVYRFDDGWHIDRMLSFAAIRDLLPGLQGHLTVNTQTVSRNQETAETGHAAIYALRKPDGDTHTFAFALLGRPCEEFGFQIFEWNDWEKHKDVARAYWLPFAMDTIWRPGDDYTYWNGFWTPIFIDDRVFDRLASPPRNLKERFDALTQEMAKQQMDDLFAEWDHTSKRLVLDALKGAEDGDLAGIEGVHPTQEQFRSNPDLFEYVEFALSGRKKMLLSLQPSFQRVTRHGVASSRVKWHVMDTADGESIGSGPTPLAALESLAQDDDESMRLLRWSARDEWFERNLNVGAPTFDTEPYHLLDAPTPVLFTDEAFRGWVRAMGVE